MSGALVWGLAIVGSYVASVVLLTVRGGESLAVKALLDAADEPMPHLIRQLRSKGLKALMQPEVAWAAVCVALLILVFGIPVGRELLGVVR